MFKKIIAIVSIMLAITLFVTVERVNGVTSYELASDPFTEPTKIRCTCYTDSGITYSGQPVRLGIVAGCKEWQGYVIQMYEVADDGSVGDFIGFYEILDTGAGIDSDGDGKGDTIINGQSIDVWLPSLADVKTWQEVYGDYVYIKITKGVG